MKSESIKCFPDVETLDGDKFGFFCVFFKQEHHRNSSVASWSLFGVLIIEQKKILSPSAFGLMFHFLSKYSSESPFLFPRGVKISIIDSLSLYRFLCLSGSPWCKRLNSMEGCDSLQPALWLKQFLLVGKKKGGEKEKKRKEKHNGTSSWITQCLTCSSLIFRARGEVAGPRSDRFRFRPCKEGYLGDISMQLQRCIFKD